MEPIGVRPKAPDAPPPLAACLLFSLSLGGTKAPLARLWD